MAPAVAISPAAAYSDKRRYDAASEAGAGTGTSPWRERAFYTATDLLIGYSFKWSTYLAGGSGLSNTGALGICVDTVVIIVAGMAGRRPWTAAREMEHRYNVFMADLLEARGLTKHYGPTIALDNATFSVQSGITGLLGPNGAGKSTAMKLFLGLIRPTSGVATIMGAEPYGSPDGRARVGYMPEHDALPPNVTATEFLMHMAQVSGLPPAFARMRTADTLRHVGLEEERYRPLGGYSTGMKQRVKLAQALVHDPVLVLLDEPTAGLDPSGRDEMLDLIKRTRRAFSISIMLSTHLLGDVERVVDAVVVLESGAVSRQGSVAQFTAETESLLVEITDRRDEFTVALRAKGVAPIERGHMLVVEGAGDAEYDLIRDAVVESGARLRRLTPQRGTLTDIFRDGPA